MTRCPILQQLFPVTVTRPFARYSLVLYEGPDFYYSKKTIPAVVVLSVAAFCVSFVAVPSEEYSTFDSQMAAGVLRCSSES